MDAPKREVSSHVSVLPVAVVGQKRRGVKLKANEAKLITFHPSKGMEKP